VKEKRTKRGTIRETFIYKEGSIYFEARY